MKVSSLSRYVWAANAFCRNIEILASAESSTTAAAAAAAFVL